MHQSGVAYERRVGNSLPTRFPRSPKTNGALSITHPTRSTICIHQSGVAYKRRVGNSLPTRFTQHQEQLIEPLLRRIL